MHGGVGGLGGAAEGANPLSAALGSRFDALASALEDHRRDMHDALALQQDALQLTHWQHHGLCRLHTHRRAQSQHRQQHSPPLQPP